MHQAPLTCRTCLMMHWLVHNMDVLILESKTYTFASALNSVNSTSSRRVNWRSHYRSIKAYYIRSITAACSETLHAASANNHLLKLEDENDDIRANELENKKRGMSRVKRIMIQAVEKRICWVSERCGFACFGCGAAEIRVLLVQERWRGLSNSRRIITQTAANVTFCYWNEHTVLLNPQE